MAIVKKRRPGTPGTVGQPAPEVAPPMDVAPGGGMPAGGPLGMKKGGLKKASGGSIDRAAVRGHTKGSIY
jgi:hypothetical protein